MVLVLHGPKDNRIPTLGCLLKRFQLKDDFFLMPVSTKDQASRYSCLVLWKLERNLTR